MNTPNDSPPENTFGLLREKSLHAELKQWYAQPDDRFEVKVDGYLIDLVRGEQLIEVQTRNFYAMKTKLTRLLDTHPICVVHPIPANRWIVKLDSDGTQSRRKSPKRGRIEDVFREVLRIPHLIPHPNFTLEVLLIHDEEIRRNDGKGSWRRKGWSIFDRRLLEVIETVRFESLTDWVTLLPAELPDEFTVRDVADRLGIKRPLAQKMVYSLRHMEVIQQIGKAGRAYLYTLSSS